jgi:large subunit ribosomal protein L25
MAYELQAETRTVYGKKVKTLRQVGKIPAEIYGRGRENQSIQIDGKTLRRVLDEAGSNHLISIQVDGQSSVMALARDIQYSILRKDLLHVDFYTVIMTETVEVTVPIHLVGKSPLVDDEGGTLVSGLNFLEIEALPGNLPEAFEVDISVLENFSEAILVSDLTIPEGVTVHSSPDSMVATIQPPRLAEELEAILEETVVAEEGIAEEEALATEAEEEEEESAAE